MTRISPIITVLLIIVVALAGCTANTADAADAAEPPKPTAWPEQSTAIVHRYNGTSSINEIGVCTTSCHYGVRVGDTWWTFPNDIVIPLNFTQGFVTISWDATPQDEVQELLIYVFQGEFDSSNREDIIVVEKGGESPITLAFSRDELKNDAPLGRLGVGFTTHGMPATVLLEEEVQWDAVLLSTP